MQSVDFGGVHGAGEPGANSDRDKSAAASRAAIERTPSLLV